MSEPTESVPSFFFMLTVALLGLFIIGALFYAANTSNVDDSAAATVLGALPSFTCGVSTVQDADGNTYNTVQIGAQCWMKQNMRVGTRISGVTAQTNNATIEKWCYSNSDANCTSDNPNQPDGGLYQWNEAMQYSTTPGAQGICPSGWHIPTHDELTTLERAVCTSGTCATDFPYDTITTGYRGTDESTKLKPNGTSGFEFNLAGYGFSGSFDNRGTGGLVWSSSESGANAWVRLVISLEARVYRGTYSKSFGFSVRCLKDDPNPPNPTFTIANTITSPGSTLEDGLVGHWTFDGPTISGTTVTDLTGGEDLSMVNSPLKVPGKMGQGIGLRNSRNQYLLEGPNPISALNQFTLSAWIKPSSYGQNNAGAIIHNGVASNWYFNVGNGSTGKLRFKSEWFTPGIWDSGPTITLDEWQHVTVTYNTGSAANDPTFYINGVAVAATEVSTPSNFYIQNSNNSLYIGNNSSVSGDFDGSMDDVRIYNRILSAAEVEQLYRLGQGSGVKICKVDSAEDADANVYNTMAIGSQCWLDRNMNVGTRISAATSQTNNGTIEKWCYSNLDSNCNDNHPNKPDGGLYQWDEAMQYSTTEGAQGICPAGFHIPTDAEWHTLEKFLKDSGQSCDAARSAYGCASAGTKLKSNGISGFEANLAGRVNAGSSFARDTDANFFSSSGSVTIRTATFGRDDISRGTGSNTIGRSVRCIQD